MQEKPLLKPYIDIDIFISKLCCWLLALSPILQHYKGFIKNAGFSALLVISPFIFTKLLTKLTKTHSLKSFLLVLPLVFFELYKMLCHGLALIKFMYGFFMILMFIAMASDCINIKYLLKCTVSISCLAGVALMMQYIFYYSMKKHICLVPVKLMLPESASWIPGVTSGLIDIRGKPNGFYRPAGFFMEPSHVFLYCFPNICILLLSENRDKERMLKAVLITIGVILSTSGMGIFVVCGIWGVFICFYNDKKKKNVADIKNFFRLENFIAVIILILCLVACYFCLGVVRNAVNRIFSSSTGSSAIGGRVNQALALVKTMRGKQLLFGVTDDVSDITFNLSGFFAMIYEYGICGLLLSYIYYVKALFTKMNETFWIGFIIIIISFFTAHTHGTFYLLYYSVILFTGKELKR